MSSLNKLVVSHSPHVRTAETTKNIMFDVVDSRRYLDRYDIQNLLMRSIEYLNDIYSCAIKKEITTAKTMLFQLLYSKLLCICCVKFKHFTHMHSTAVIFQLKYFQVFHTYNQALSYPQ